MGLVFELRSERDAFVRKIKEEGLFSTIDDEIKSQDIKDLLSIVFDFAFERLDEDDYDNLVEEVCENIDYNTNDIWEVYLDREEYDDFTNDNYSCFIVSKTEPTLEQAKEILDKHGQLDKNYHIRFIQESDWDDVEESDLMYL